MYNFIQKYEKKKEKEKKVIRNFTPKIAESIRKTVNKQKKRDFFSTIYKNTVPTFKNGPYASYWKFASEYRKTGKSRLYGPNGNPC